MQGEPNAALLDGAEFRGAVRTEPRYTLVNLGEYPALCPGGTTAIWGEVYSVPVDSLSKLDEFEGPEYKRDVIRIDGENMFTYMCIQPPSQPLVIESGDWRRR